ncbi:hypothetical protein [uncultured Tyzzerella sp.]|uniref:hypothetical protein n=1 Tax=uncultured Tyzzerella sp. TaxID=2321398 RepID=UPI002943C374|nr:hypothetical protein [uncultured Tyzzerella sp.]
MDTLNQLINMMLTLIAIGAVTKLASHILGLMYNIEEKETYIKKIKNCIIAFVISGSVFTIKEIIEHYFK